MRLFYFFLLIPLFSCLSKQESETSISITGSSTVAPLIAEIAKRYEQENPGFRIDVQTGGSSRGISDTVRGISDIGMVSRALKQEESSLKHYTIATDGIGIITNAATKIEGLDKQTIVKIFTGKIKNWKDIGGPDQKITVIHKAQGRSTSELFIKYFSLTYGDIEADIVIGDNEQGIKNVAFIPGAIGYVSIGAAEHAIKTGSSIKLVSLDGKFPSSRAVSEGEYPIIRPLNLVTNSKLSKESADFIQYAQSQSVFDIVRKLDFVPQTL